MYGVQFATVWASVSGMAGPVLAQITASGEAVAVFTTVVVGLCSAITVLFKMLLSEQKEHRKHISELVKSHDATIENLKTEYLAVIKEVREECKSERDQERAEREAERKLFLGELQTERTLRAEIEEKRQVIEQQRHSDYMALAHAINKFSDRKGNAQPPSR